MTIQQSLKSLSAYPIPSATIANIAEGLGLVAEAEATREVRASRDFKRAQAQVYLFLVEAPNVSQGGVSFSFTDEERRRFRLRAESLLEEAGDEDNLLGDYGYMGSDL